MAYLNRDEREKLLHDLTTMKVPQIRGKLRRMDPHVKLRFMRNAQTTGEFMTRLDLPGQGIIVTLVERDVNEATTTTTAAGSASVRLSPDFRLQEVVIDPTPENKT